MKLISLLLVFITGGGLNAAEVLGGEIMADHTVRLRIRYRGGDKPHEFKLKNGVCSANLPASCDLILIDITTDDRGSQSIETTVTLQNHLIGSRAIGQIYIVGDAKSTFVVDQSRSIGVRQ